MIGLEAFEVAKRSRLINSSSEKASDKIFSANVFRFPFPYRTCEARIISLVLALSATVNRSSENSLSAGALLKKIIPVLSEGKFFARSVFVHKK